MVNTSLTASHGDIYDISIKKEYSTGIMVTIKTKPFFVLKQVLTSKDYLYDI
jgi:hypothetical protein